MKFKKEYFLYALIIIASFIIYAPINYKFLNSDQGIHALMAVDFDWENCTYYWGQNRLGSILPLLASFIVKLNIDPLWAVSIIQYVLLVATFLLSCKMVSSTILKLAILIFLFFPLVSFVEYLNVGHPYTPQILLILVLYLLYQKIDGQFSVKTFFLIISFWVVSALSVWVSELSIIPVVLLVVYLFIKLNKESSLFSKKHDHLPTPPFVYSIAFGFFFIFVVQRFLKQEFKDPVYESFGVNAINQTIGAFKEQVSRYLNAVSFEDGFSTSNLFTLLITCYSVYLVVLLVRNFEKSKIKNYFQDKSFLFLLISGLTFCAINFSEWAGIENFPHRYYVFSYVCFGFSVVFFTDTVSLKPTTKKLMTILLMLTFTVGSLSYLTLDKEQTRFKNNDKGYSVLRSINQSTFIGDYWYAYVIGAYNATKITAIACEQSHIRNPHQISKAFNNSEVYLIKNNWLEKFPDTMNQYGKLLLKNNSVNDVVIGNAIVHKYINQSLLEEENTVKKFRNKIMKDKVWVDIVDKKAKEAKITFEEMLEKDIQFLMLREREIIKCEHVIRRDSNWMNSITKKAKENNVSVDEMIRLDAEYVVNQKEKENKSTGK